MTATLLIGSYCRPNYLRWHLDSLLPHTDDLPCPCRIVVLNDGIEDETEEVAKEYNVDYLFTGQRNKKGKIWRCPGFAFNIGIKQFESTITILSCAEIFHVNNTLKVVLDASLADDKALVTPKVADDHGPLLAYLKSDRTARLKPLVKMIKRETKARRKRSEPFIANGFMPYFMAIHRERLLEIGGYDEDFTGRGADDNDLVHRLKLHGCHYQFVGRRVIHINHSSSGDDQLKADPNYQYNVRLWKERKSQIVRNVNREWGKLDVSIS